MRKSKIRKQAKSKMYAAFREEKKKVQTWRKETMTLLTSMPDCPAKAAFISSIKSVKTMNNASTKSIPEAIAQFKDNPTTNE